MEQKPPLTSTRDQILHVPTAQLHLHTTTTNTLITLEDRCIRMIDPSDKQQQQQQNPQKSTTTSLPESSSTTISSIRPSDTASLPPPEESQVEQKQSQATTTTTSSSTTRQPQCQGHQLSSTESSATTTSALAVATTPLLIRIQEDFKPKQEQIAVGVESKGLSRSLLSSPSLLRTPDAATSLPPPPSPTPSSASSEGRREEDQQDDATGLMGRKRPTHEERLTLTVPDLQHGEEAKGSPRSPRTDSDGSSSSSWSQPHVSRTRSATTTSKLSTSEQFIPGDQPFRDKSNSEGKLSVQFSLATSPPKRDVAHVMEFFQEQEKNLQERFLSLRKHPPRKQRSPSPNIQQKLGLEHLDNLVRLMQQLTSLKDENTRLRKRCDYLESTKNLLQAKKELGPEGGKQAPSGPVTFSTKQKKQHHSHRFHHHQQHHHQQQLHQSKSFALQETSPPLAGNLARARISGTIGGIDFLEKVDSSSDQRPRTPKKALHKRSFSTGSIEVDLLDSQVMEVSSDYKSSKSKHDGKSSAKQKGKNSKWARVKKVLTGQKLYEDLNTTIKSLREFGRSSHLRYSAPTSQAQRGSSAARTYRRSDSIPTFGPGKEMDAQGTHPTYSEYQVMETTEALDLSSDIWMGPADWWEEYEANKESATSASSDVSSVIEVTTMYLGTKPDDMSTSVTTSTSTSSSSSATTTSTTILKSASQGRLSVMAGLPRRKSSPLLNLNGGEEEDDEVLLEELASRTEPVRFLHKSSSCKSADLDLPKSSLDSKDSVKKFHKTAWGRVKDIIHTRKDSMKRKPRKEKCGMLIEAEESSEIDMDALLDENWHADLFAEGLLSRSTPKSSPMVIRQSPAGGEQETKGSAALSKSMTAATSSHPTMDMAALLGRSMSDDFNKKLQEWEEIKTKKSSIKASVEDSEMCSLDVSQDVKTVELKDLTGSIPEVCTESLVTEDSNTSLEVMGLPSVCTEDMAKKKMTESFSRKMQEWERMKYKGSPGPFRDVSPEMERKGSKGKKEERHKSKRSREEKEKEKLERQREREMQKVEREQLKLEKEKLRIEKERLRALEREAKLEKLKGRLSHADCEGIAKNPVLSPLAEYKVTADFAHKLHEWELRKGLSHAVSNSVYLEAHKIKSMHQLKEGPPSEASSRHGSSRFSFDPVAEPQEPGSAQVQPYWDSNEETSPVEKLSEPSLDDTSVTDEFRTTSNIPTLERANAQLLQELRKKELEYLTVQDEVQNLNQKLTAVKEDHASEMARFHQEGTVSGPVKLELGELERVMGDVEEKIRLMETEGESIAQSMESAAVGKWQSIEGEESVHMQLVELVAQMRNMLIQATQSEEASQKTSALTNFEVLYSQAMKLQVQMNNLRLSHLERNREIMVIKRQLLLQEVNNLVLQADITRREAELYQFHESKKFSTSLRRWNTFSGKGSERQRPQTQIELPNASTKPKTCTISTTTTATSGSCTTKPLLGSGDDGIQRLQEQGIPLASISAPCSPLAKTAGDELALIQTTFTDHTLPVTPVVAQEHATDRQENLLVTHDKHSKTIDTHIAASTIVSGEQRPEETPDKASKTSDLTESPSSVPAKLSRSKQVDETDVDNSACKPTTKEKDNILSVPISTLTEYKTQFDSVPLQQEIEALRREKAKVEKGSPTLKKHKADSDPSSIPSPGLGQRNGAGRLEIQHQTIPKQSSRDSIPRLQKAAQIIDDDFPIAQSVIECDPHSPQPDHTTTQPMTSTAYSTTTRSSGSGDGLSLNLPSPPSPSNLSALPPISDQSRAGSRSPRSPVSKHKLLRRQKEKEERENKSKDYSAISPKGSPVMAARGKPPLPRQDRQVRHSPSSSPCMSDRGIKSKSQSDVDSVPRSPSHTTKPLQEAINKFEKRATICETEDRPVELRKTPSPTLHLPRVGLVSRVRKLKPAAELLEESQRYRSGQSIYATRILPKYLSKDESKPEGQAGKHNKENVSGSYVQSVVQRLSRESTPARSLGSSRTTSNSSLHWTDVPRTQSEFVSQIVRKLSSSSGPDSLSNIIAPLADLTNEDKKRSTAGRSEISLISDQDILNREKSRYRETSHSKCQGQTTPSTTHERRSCEVAMVLSSKSSPGAETYTIVSAVSTGSVATCQDVTTTSVISPVPTNHHSLPSLSTSTATHTTPTSPKTSAMRGKSSGHTKDVSFEIEPEFSSLTSASSVFRSPSEEEREEEETGGVRKRSKEKRGRGETRRLLASLSPVRKVAGRGRMETVGVLCKQSISFDLGVSQYAADDPVPSKKKGAVSKSRKPRSWDPSESVAAEAAAAAAVDSPHAPTSSSTSAIECADVMTSSVEGEMASAAPTSPTEKKKSKRFLDSNWLQKSKRFFKVSK